MKQLMSIVVLMVMVGNVVAEDEVIELRDKIKVLKEVGEKKDALIVNLEKQIEIYQRWVEGYQKQIEEYQKQGGGKVVIVQEPVLTEEQKAAMEKEAELRRRVEQSSGEWLDKRIEEARKKEIEKGNTHCSRSFLSKEDVERSCARGASWACDTLELYKDCW